jgi:hypothetical protein
VGGWIGSALKTNWEKPEDFSQLVLKTCQGQGVITFSSPLSGGFLGRGFFRRSFLHRFFGGWLLSGGFLGRGFFRWSFLGGWFLGSRH